MANCILSIQLKLKILMELVLPALCSKKFRINED